MEGQGQGGGEAFLQTPPACGARGPCSALAYLADQFWDAQRSINLLEAIEVPQGQIQLV